jgi:predicted Fe-Mo cluster-binding NifX family protein
MSEERLIVVAADDACGFDGEVSAHFGRCPFFLLAEASGKMVTISRVLPNPYVGAHEPGDATRFIHELGANVIIAGGMGPGAAEMFNGFGIDVATGVTGSVATVLGTYVRGEHRGVVSCADHHGVGCSRNRRPVGGTDG